jgi:hypothetical protein
MLKNLSLMVEEAKEFSIENALYSREGKKRKPLSSLKSYDGRNNGYKCDLLKYVANMKTDWDGNIRRVKYELIPHVVKYDWAYFHLAYMTRDVGFSKKLLRVT